MTDCNDSDHVPDDDLSIDEYTSTNTLPQYTFMGWDSRSLPNLPYGYGNEFPAFLTNRAGLDFQVIDMMRSFFDKGVSFIL